MSRYSGSIFFVACFVIVFLLFSFFLPRAHAVTNSFSVDLSVTAPSGGGGGGDTTPPSATTFLPANNGVGVAVNTTLSVTFSELVNKSSGSITVRRLSDDSLVETVSVTDSAVSLTGATAVVTLASPLSSATSYYVEITAGSFVDQASNAFLGISGSSVWSFTTVDATPPIISGVTITPDVATATVVFTTDEPAIGTLAWGTTTEYASGVASEIVSGTNHSFSLSGLLSGTLYYIRITATDGSSNQSTWTGSLTTLVPPDTTPPLNPSAFTAVSSGQTAIALAWSDPGDADFLYTRVMRGSGTYPVDPSDGVLVYQGTAEEADDTGLTADTTYYYSAFARDVSGNFSSGAIAHAKTDEVPPPPPPPPPPPGGEDLPPGGGGSTEPGPGTTTPPVVIPPLLSTSTGPFPHATGTASLGFRNFTLPDALFIAVRDPEKQLPPDNNGVVSVDGAYPIRIVIPASRLPEVLKTIVVTVADESDPERSTSVLLRINDDKSAYEGVLPPFPRSGGYPFMITLYDVGENGIVRLPGTFRVLLPKTGSVFPPAVAELVSDIVDAVEEPVEAIAPITAPLGVAVGISQGVILASNASSFYDLYLLGLRLLGLLTGLFRRKKREPWGVVYDSITKRPLDPAYVVASTYGGKSSEGEAITDLDGRYGFVLKPGEYMIVANKTHYKFPSEKLKGKAHDELYENLYFGDPFAVKEGSIVEYNIPLDPIEFDWNEFAKNQDKVFKVYSRKEKWRVLIFNTIFYFGLAFSSVALFFTPSMLNVGIVSIYIAILIFQLLWRANHRLTRVMHKETASPLPYAIVKAWFPGLDTVARKVVADEMGRLYFLVPPGKYYFTVEEKLSDGTYKEVLRTGEKDLKKGVVTEDLLV